MSTKKNNHFIPNDKLIIEFFAFTVLLVLLNSLLRVTDSDLIIMHYIYHSGHGWYGVDRFPWNIFYTYAPLPGLLIVGLALFLLAASFVKQSMRKYRRQAVFLCLLMALGPGLIVNVVLKDNMGRARPIGLSEFGGNYQYSEAWQYRVSPGQKSFPSGHASVAFALMAPWFIFRSNGNKRAVFFLVGGFSFGLLVGYTRMLQGGHFPSDILWAGGLVYLCGIVLSGIILTPTLELSPIIFKIMNNLHTTVSRVQSVFLSLI